MKERRSDPEKAVQQTPHLASAMLTLPFAAIMLVVGQQFIERQALSQDVMQLPVRAKTRYAVTLTPYPAARSAE